MERMQMGTEAEEQDEPLEELRAALRDLPLLPEDLIAEVHAHGYAEDGSYQLVADTTEGKTMVVTFTPGEPLRVYVQ